MNKIINNICKKISCLIHFFRSFWKCDGSKNREINRGINLNDAYEDSFSEAYKIALKQYPHEIPNKYRYRDFMVSQFAKHATSLKGDFVCIGVSWGCAARLIAEYCNLGEKSLFLVDSFQRFENPNSPLIESYCGDVSHIEKTLAKLSNVKVILGLAPEALEAINNRKLAFVHISIDFEEAEVQSILKLYNQCVPGACILVDCYGNGNHGKGWGDKSKKYLRDKNIQIIPLLTSQGLIIKT